MTRTIDADKLDTLIFSWICRYEAIGRPHSAEVMKDFREEVRLLVSTENNQSQNPVNDLSNNLDKSGATPSQENAPNPKDVWVVRVTRQGRIEDLPMMNGEYARARYKELLLQIPTSGSVLLLRNGEPVR